MAGKTDTRQKMINMMYLVFIAMLALNIGKEVLATIGVINEDLENSTSQFKSNSEGIYKKFDVLGVSEPAWAEALPVINELKKYDEELFKKPRWLILNKIDLANDIAHIKDRIIKELGWDAPIFEISAINGEGCDNLSKKIMEYIDTI